MRIAADIDPGYAEAAARAHDAGVEALAYGAVINPEGVTFGAERSIGAANAG